MLDFDVCTANLVRALMSLRLSLQSTAASGGASAKGPRNSKPSLKRSRSSDERGDSTGHGDAEEAEESGPADALPVPAAAQPSASSAGSGEVVDATVTRMAAFGLHHVNDAQMRTLLREYVPYWASVKQHGAQRFLWRMLYLAGMDEQAVLHLNFSSEIRRVHCLVCAHAICSCTLVQ